MEFPPNVSAKSGALSLMLIIFCDTRKVKDVRFFRGDL